MTECCICNDQLTMKTIVNLECGHRFCKDCIWRWTKDKNTCPCCRGNILGNTKELQEMQHMRELITHRSQIVRQVEEEYERVDMLKTRANEIERGIRLAEKQLDRNLGESDREQKKITFYRELNQGTYSAIKYLEKKLQERNKNMETIQTKDYHEFVLQGEILIELKDLHSEAKQKKMHTVTLITIRKRQKKVQLNRQQWQEELSLIDSEIDNEGLRLERIFNDENSQYSERDDYEQEDIFSDMPPLEPATFDWQQIGSIHRNRYPNIYNRDVHEDMDNMIQVNDREAFLNNIIQYFNDIDPLNNNINNNNVNNNNMDNIFLA